MAAVIALRSRRGVATYIGILAALQARAERGTGQEVDVSIAETAATMGTGATAFAYSGMAEARSAGATRCAAATAGSWCGSTITSGKGFCDAIDAPALFADPRFAHPNDRQRNWAELMRILQAHVADRPAAEVVSRLQEKRLIAAKAAHLTELVRDHPHLSARGFFETVATEAGPRLVLGPPFRMARTPRVLRGDAPAPPAAEAEMHR